MQVIICYLQKMVVQMSAMIGFVRPSVQILLRGIEVGGGQTQEDWAKINRFGGFDEMTSNFAENAITLAGTAINFAMNAIWSFLERYSPFWKRRIAKGIDRSDFFSGATWGPQVSMQAIPNSATCMTAVAQTILDTVKSNVNAEVIIQYDGARRAQNNH